MRLPVFIFFLLVTMVCVKSLPSQRSGFNCAKSLLKDFKNIFPFQQRGGFLTPGTMVHYDRDDQRLAGSEKENEYQGPK